MLPSSGTNALEWEKAGNVAVGVLAPTPRQVTSPRLPRGGPARNLSPRLHAPALVFLGGEVNSPAGMLSQEAPAPNVLPKCGTW